MSSPIMPAVGSILPQPFEWVVIPEGQVTLEAGSYLDDDTVFDVPQFAIGKYPITNAQYAVFMQAGGYDNLAWWTDEGKAFLSDKTKQKKPRYWGNLKFSKPAQPVLGMSSFEASAFTTWLQDSMQSYYPSSEAQAFQISLPTEQQWQRAVQALPDGRDSKRQYPWGDDWDAQACNHSVSRNRLQRTSPVDAYETKGNVSPCGVVDMAGNAWEWCLTHVLTGSQEKEGSDARVHRGGSWFDDDPNRFKVTARHKPFPGFWTLYWAFRICLTF